jgi:hypothetical protein
MNPNGATLLQHSCCDVHHSETSGPFHTEIVDGDIRLWRGTCFEAEMTIKTEISFLDFVCIIHTQSLSLMALRHNCLRIRPRIRLFHTSRHVSATSSAKPPSMAKATSPTSTIAPFPPISRPAENDPTYVHPESSVKAGVQLKGIQLLKDKPEIVALPDDYYPDWLWQLLDPRDSTFIQERLAEKRTIELKKDYYVSEKVNAEADKEIERSTKAREVKPGEKRNMDERRAARMGVQSDRWRLNREKEYARPIPQFEMPPERNAKYHKKFRIEKIKQDNYDKARGMKK